MSPLIIEDAYQRVDFDRELVFKFFIAFSLFEKALKENGFHRAKGNSEDIQPDWDKFSKDIDNQFLAMINLPNHSELETAVNYLLNHPPKKTGVSR